MVCLFILWDIFLLGVLDVFMKCFWNWKPRNIMTMNVRFWVSWCFSCWVNDCAVMRTIKCTQSVFNDKIITQSQCSPWRCRCNGIYGLTQSKCQHLSFNDLFHHLFVLRVKNASDSIFAWKWLPFWRRSQAQIIWPVYQFEFDVLWSIGDAKCVFVGFCLVLE